MILFIYLFLIYLFIYLWLHWVFIALHQLSLVAASGDSSALRCAGFSLRWLLLLQTTGSRHPGFSSCGTRAQQLWLMGSRVHAQQLWCIGLVAPRHVGSSRTRVQTHVPYIGRWILNHYTTREVPIYFFKLRYSLFTILYQFQVYSKLIQLYIYMYLFFFRFFSHRGHYRVLSRVPCAIQ